MTTKTTAKITARRKIAAAALALGAGVLGTGFAAGTLNFNAPDGHGMGQGKITSSQLNQQEIDITGTLNIERGATLTWDTNTLQYVQTVDPDYTITGFDAVSNAMDAHYEVRAKYGQNNSKVIEEGTVTPGLNVTVAPKDDGYMLANIQVVIAK